MHACGHDSHSAMLAARRAASCAPAARRFAGRHPLHVPARRGGHHGARDMIAEGLLDDPAPEAAFALHVWPNLPGGIVACRAGRDARLDRHAARATIVGKGGHAAMPHDALDPVPVAGRSRCSRCRPKSPGAPRSRPTRSSCRSPGSPAGTTHNVMPDEVELLGTLRTLSPTGRTRGPRRVRADLHPCRRWPTAAPPRSRSTPAIPPTINDPRAVALIRAACRRCAMSRPRRRAWAARISPMCCERIPGAMAFLGVAPAGRRSVGPRADPQSGDAGR